MDMADTMRSLSAADVLRAWEMGQRQHPLERPLTLLALGTGLPRNRLASLPIGQRDALLLFLREATLGPRMDCGAGCPECAQQVEMSFYAGDIRLYDPVEVQLEADGDPEAGEISEQSRLTGELGSYQLSFRLPNTADLAALLDARDAQEALQTLISRCVIEVRREGALLDTKDLPVEVISWIGDRIAQADPQGDILLDLTCPNCDHRWQAVFDIGAYFWKEIATISKRLLYDVHALASAYGWRETDILNMSAIRREAYLEMVLG